MAHRLLFEYLHNGKSAGAEFYEQNCKHASQMEIQAADAERASVRYKQVEYIKDFIGTEFSGIISGVTEWGIYVEITEYKCEGMIRLSSMTDDFYQFDEMNQWIMGRRSKKVYQLGGQVTVRVKNADVQRRQIDLELMDALPFNRAVKRLNPKKKKEKKEVKRKKRRR